MLLTTSSHDKGITMASSSRQVPPLILYAEVCRAEQEASSIGEAEPRASAD